MPPSNQKHDRVHDAAWAIAGFIIEGKSLSRQELISICESFGLSEHTAADFLHKISADGISSLLYEHTGVRAQKSTEREGVRQRRSYLVGERK